MKTKTGKIIISAMFASLICVATMIIKVPSPLGGYLNLGDGLVLLGAWMLSPLYSFFAAGIGSALADILSGYAVYAPATFIIKGLMAMAAYYIFAALIKKGGADRHGIAARIAGGIAAELIMILGYFVFEGFLYGFAAVLVNIPANGVQGAVGIILGVILSKLLEKIKFHQ